MVWIIAGVLLAVVLIGAWFYDRKFSHDRGYDEAGGGAQGKADGSVTQLGQWNGPG